MAAPLQSAKRKGVVVVDGASYSFTLSRKNGHSWPLSFTHVTTRVRGTSSFKNGDDFYCDATVVKRIREALERTAARTAAPPPAPPPVPSPHRSGRAPRVPRPAAIHNVGHGDCPPDFPTKRKPFAERQAETKRRKAEADEDQEKLKSLDGALADYERIAQLRRRALARARDAEKALQRERASSTRNETKLEELRARYHALLDDFDALSDQDVEKAMDTVDARLEAIPEFRMIGKGKGGGHGRMWPPFLRCMVFEMLVNGTKPSAVCENIVSVAAYLVPWLKVVTPTQRTVRRWRYELRVLAKALSAYRVAKAVNVAMLGTDGTEYYQTSLLTSNVQIDEDGDGELVAVVVEAAYVTPGKTAEVEVEEVQRSAFTRGRDAVKGWRDLHGTMFEDDDLEVLFPDPNHFSLSRLGGGGVIMGDTCNQANRVKELLARSIEDEFEAKDPEWESLDGNAREERCRVYQMDCWNHLRNVWFGNASKVMVAVVRDELRDHLSNFDGHSRVSPDISQLLRGVFKEFHQGGEYAKGKGRDYHAWLEDNYPDIFYINEARAQGGRQDLDYEAAVAIYINRPYYLKFLNHIMRDPGHSNILEDYLYVVLMSKEMNALVRAHAAMYITFVEDLRTFAGKGHEWDGFSPFTMALLADRLEHLMIEGAADGQIVLDLLADGTSPFSELEKTYAGFKAYRTYRMNQQCTSPNGKTTHNEFNLLSTAIADPKDASDKATTARTVELIQTCCERILKELRDPKKRTARYLASQNGSLAAGSEAARAGHETTKGCYATNDVLAESVFGAIDQIMREFRTIGVAAASGVITARRNGDFNRAAGHVVKRVSKAPSPRPSEPMKQGAFHGLTANQRASLVEYARRAVEEARKLDAEVQKEHDTYWEKKRAATRDASLKLLIKKAVDTRGYYDLRHRRRTSIAEVRQDLASITATSTKFDYLKDQIKIRVLGFGWADQKVTWAGKTLDDLTKDLEALIDLEKERGVPTEEPVAQLARKTLTQLGAPIEQLEELEASAAVDQADFERAVAAERTRRTNDREVDPFGVGQAAVAPPIDDSLQDQRVEVCRWVYPSEGGRKLFWFAGVVKQVSDGTVAKGGRSKKNWAEGYARIEFDAQPMLGDEEPTEEWVLLRPNKWNRTASGCWRLDLDGEDADGA